MKSIIEFYIIETCYTKFCLTKTPYHIFLPDSNVNFKTNFFGIRLTIYSTIWVDF